MSESHNETVITSEVTFQNFESFDSDVQGRLETLANHGESGYILRAPGRVNLLGEHVDYSGFGVMPMAVASDVCVKVSTPSSGLVIDNVESRFDTKTYENLTADELTVDLANHHWSHYVLCGYKAAFDAMGKKGFAPTALKPLRLTVYGNVPAGSGLSSSSALVVASTLAVCSAYDFEITRTELAVAAIEGERHVGTLSGGMDQSASILSQTGSALYIQFVPSLTASRVTLPAGVTFVICNCLKKKEKAVDASQYYNKRVVECRLAALLLAKRYNLPLEGVKTLRNVVDATVSSPADMLGTMVELAEVAKQESVRSETSTLVDVAVLLGCAEGDILSTYFSDRATACADVFADSAKFSLWKRAQHVFEESARVMGVAETMPDGPEFGKVMNASHESCRDLFECSCDELNKLVAICLESGALGSRLTGAGWGGCNVSCVKEGEVDAFIASVKQKYYVEFMGMEEVPDNAICVSNGSCGASRVVMK